MPPLRNRPTGTLALAGLTATWIAMTLGYWLPGIGLPRMDFAIWNGNLLVPNETAVSLSWCVGAIQTLGLGTLVGIAYGRLARPRLPGKPAVRGAIWGAALAVLAGMVLMPLLYGAGMFGLRWDPAMPVSVALWHLAYGISLGVAEQEI